MRAASISSPQIFYDWLVQEGKYLQNLCSMPPKETLSMEYYIKLEALKACKERLGKVHQTNSLETKHCNEQENERKLLADIHALETKLEVEARWVEGSEEWNSAKRAVKEGAYQKALDNLEKLLVE
ncbi:hypothetical protein BDP27DRAFT_1231957 [Rhodocollybia butyracea]|uniref:Uncharacterized protein n=1 Tax=Rhodocollybia butyracea TaxID=206335 RepID=A0A9P5PHT9_9AGAR|nr:hypothetical protein BDP27DRAFT_1231957 [Rhodocollybia butyracea]